MKLRLTSNSLRVRLSSAEVRVLGARGALEERVVLDPSGRGLVYRVELVGGEGLGVRFDGERLSVRVPRSLAEDWLAGCEEGLEAEVAGPEGAIRVTVETDRVG